MSILEDAIRTAQDSEICYTKFITPNDTGMTGGHQSGYHIHKNSWKLLFKTPGIKGENKDKLVRIKWHKDFTTDSRFIYYGVGTRNEYRITRFGKGFPFLTEENVGDLLILCKISGEEYEGFVFHTDDDIEDFLTALNITVTEVNRILPKQEEFSNEKLLHSCFKSYIQKVNADFPQTIELANTARSCYLSSFKVTEEKIRSNPDKEIIKWIETEYQLFKVFENDRYKKIIQNKFESVEDLVKTANTILNRRKSRAGRSLEHHLEEIFKVFSLNFDSQVITENNKKPDFLFPSLDAYKNSKFETDKLTFLASKTTCKDRWRQVLNEADRIKLKHLFTLQQGVSMNQLNEMKKYGVKLVVPKSNLESFPKEGRAEILTLKLFVKEVMAKQV